MTKIKSDSRKSSRQLNKSSKKIILSVTALAFIYLLVSLAVCLLMFIAELPQESIYYIILISLVISTFLGGFLTGKIHMKNGLINALIYNLPFILLIFFISLVLNNFKFDYKAVITLLIMLISSATGGIFAVNSSRKKR